MKGFWVGLGTFILLAIIGLSIFFFATPTGKSIWNKYDYAMNKVDEKTYENQKGVEDTCRSMIASYKNDKLIYEQYKDSSDDLERQMSNNAKTRANQTASTYNNYILKNKYVWKDNIPADIYSELAYLE
jgi:hypothetical protein